MASSTGLSDVSAEPKAEPPLQRTADRPVESPIRQTTETQTGSDRTVSQPIPAGEIVATTADTTLSRHIDQRAAFNPQIERSVDADGANPPTIQPGTNRPQSLDVARSTPSSAANVQRQLSARPGSGPSSPTPEVQRQGLGQQSGGLPAVVNGQNKPQIIRPLTTLRSLPPLCSSIQQTASSQPNEIQRASSAPVPSQWSSLESLVSQLGGTSQAGGTSQVDSKNASGKAVDGNNLSDNPSPQTVPRSPLAPSQSSSDQTAHSQNQASDNASVRRSPDGNAGAAIPQQWSNLESLVMRLQADSSTSAAPAPSPPASGSTGNSTQSERNRTATPKDTSSKSETPQPSPASPSPKPKPIVVDNAPAVTIRRQTSSSSRSTVIQASSDAASDLPQHKSRDADAQNYSKHLELLAQEVYSLLRQRLSLEQERHGPRYPR